MKTAIPSAVAILLALVAAAQADQPSEGGPTLAPPTPVAAQAVYTRQGLFSIPFRIDGAQRNGPQPAEVRLMVSEDQGQKWRNEARVKPDQHNFSFRAPHDGEYWFSIRTIDRDGHSHPEGPYEPQLIVVVDTITPRLDLSAARGDNGEIVAQWHVLDTGLKAETFKLEYQILGGDNWLPLAIDAQLQRAAKYTLIGEATWFPPGARGPIALRASASDEAGNTAVTQVQIKSERPGLGDRTAQPDRTGQADPFNSAPGTAPSAGARDLRRAGDDRTARNGIAPGGPVAWPADAAVKGSLDSSLARAGDAAAAAGDSSSPWRSAGQGPASGHPVRGDANRVPAQMVSQVQTQPAAAVPADWSLMPIGERPRMVNLRTFELDYEVDSIGSSGVAKVELWGTRDGGRHWANYGADNDNRSPLVVSVDSEGLYGFRIVIQSGNGLSGQAPRDGDLPEVWIGVDQTRPAVRLTAVDPGPENGELLIRWETSDALLESRPVSLFFSDQPHGPWSPIAAELDASGSFAWRLDNRVPERVFLRIEARDQAGNVGVYETPDPITLDRRRPQGRIRGVRPVGQPDK